MSAAIIERKGDTRTTSESSPRLLIFEGLTIPKKGSKRKLPAITDAIPLTRDGSYTGFLLSNDTDVVLVADQPDLKKTHIIHISQDGNVLVSTPDHTPFYEWFHNQIAAPKTLLIPNRPSAEAIDYLERFMNFYAGFTMQFQRRTALSIIGNVRQMVDTALSQLSENPLVLQEVKKVIESAEQALETPRQRQTKTPPPTGRRKPADNSLVAEPSTTANGDTDNLIDEPHQVAEADTWLNSTTSPRRSGETDFPDRDSMPILDPVDEFPVENVLLHAQKGIQDLMKTGEKEIQLSKKYPYASSLKKRDSLQRQSYD